MAKSTNKNSRTYHSSRTKIKSSELAKKQQTSRHVLFLAKKSVLTIIILAMLVVTLALLLAYFLKPETIVKSKMSAISTDYYENYYYPQIVEQSSKPLPEILEYYSTHGFSQVTLRQLLLIDNERNKDASDLKNYCDENATYIQIFPEPPYGKNNYHIDYHYSCTF